MYVNVGNGQYLNARFGAGKNYNIKYYIPHGQVVTVQSTSGSWKKIVVDGFPSSGSAWVESSYLQSTAPAIRWDTQTYALGNRNIVEGMFGRYVHNLQVGLGIAADGDFGSGTRSAVENFQSANRLDVDGIAGSQTKALLWAQQSTAIIENGI